jgi:hypothetical protein
VGPRGDFLVQDVSPNRPARNKARSAAARIAGPSVAPKVRRFISARLWRDGLTILRGITSLRGHTDLAGIKWQPRMLLR